MRVHTYGSTYLHDKITEKAKSLGVKVTAENRQTERDSFPNWLITLESKDENAIYHSLEGSPAFDDDNRQIQWERLDA